MREMKVVTSFSKLMSLAYELGQARLSGDEKRIAEAEKNHDAYKKLCLEADEIDLGQSIF